MRCIRKMLLFCVILGLSVPLPVLGADLSGGLPQLFSGAESSLQAKASLPTGAVEVSVDLTLIDPSGPSFPRIRADLPDRQVVFAKDRIEERGSGNYTWFGSIEGYQLSTVVLTMEGGSLTGHISTTDGTYSIISRGGNYLVAKSDPMRVAPHGNDGLVMKRPRTGGEGRVPSSISPLTAPESGDQIDILVLYTEQMQTKYGNGIASVVRNSVDLANAAFGNSGVNTRLNLVHAELYTDYYASESTDIAGALNCITYDPHVAMLRDQYSADLVSLLRVHQHSESGLPCGMAWLMETLDSNAADGAFSVTEIRRESEANPYYCLDITFAHEIGHNLGCEHDREHAIGQGAYPFSYGYYVSGLFGTVMSYVGPNIPYFSSPLATYGGYSVGKDESQPDSADNAKTINNTRVVVANFRVKTEEACTYAISPANLAVGSGGAALTATVSASPSTCSWSASSDSPWITVVSGGSSTGNGTLIYTVQVNMGYTARTGTITAAGKELTVTQAGLETGMVSISLSQGWNFISFPNLPPQGGIESVLGPEVLTKAKIIWGYDNSSKTWKRFVPSRSDNTLLILETNKGYWFFMDDRATLSMTGWNQAPTAVHLYDGWNLIGYNGPDQSDVSPVLREMTGRWQIIWGWEEEIWKARHTYPLSPQVTPLASMQKGRAYWLKVTQGSGEVVYDLGLQKFPVSPPLVDLGPVSSRTPTTLLVSNGGNGPVTIGQAAVTNQTVPGAFVVGTDACSNSILPRLGMCSLEVVFESSSPGSYGASLSIPSDAADRPVISVPLSGRKIDPARPSRTGDMVRSDEVWRFPDGSSWTGIGVTRYGESVTNPFGIKCTSLEHIDMFVFDGTSAVLSPDRSLINQEENGTQYGCGKYDSGKKEYVFITHTPETPNGLSLEFRSPMVVGDTDTRTLHYEDGSRTQCTYLVEARETVTVPAGTFDTYKIVTTCTFWDTEGEATGYAGTAWLYPPVDFVKSIATYSPSGWETRSEMKNYYFP